MRKKESTTKRLDLCPEVVRRAKVAYTKKTGSYSEDMDLEEVYFRDVLDKAAGEFLPVITDSLQKGGFNRQEDNKYRQRPVSITTWDALDKLVSEYDVAKVQIVRALLELLARSGETTE